MFTRSLLARIWQYVSRWPLQVQRELDILWELYPDLYRDGIYRFLACDEGQILPMQYTNGAWFYPRGCFYGIIAGFDPVLAEKTEQAILQALSLPHSQRIITPIEEIMCHLWPIEAYEASASFHWITRSLLIEWIADHYEIHIEQESYYVQHA